MSDKLSSLTIFFPFLNDAGTVETSIDLAYSLGKELARDLEVIAIHGGKSKDDTYAHILKMKAKYPDLIIVDKSDNTEGYAVIKYGFAKATKDWVFYTDGDRQYHLEEDLKNLVNTQLTTGADVVNGYKKVRGDNIIRTFLGSRYAVISSLLFELPIRDTDCDFRLIRKSVLDNIKLESHDASILPELIKKLELVGAKFVEMPVSHFQRTYGESNYTAFSLFKEKIAGDLKLYLKIRKLRKGGQYRIISFLVIGLISVLLQSGFFNMLLIAGMNPTFSVILADQIVIIISFILNCTITFTDKFVINKNLLIKFFEFYLTVFVSTLVQALIVFIGTSIFGTNLLVSNISFAIGIFIGFIWNYTIQSRLIWRFRSKEING